MHSATSNRTTAEVMFGNFTNVSGAAMTIGYPVCFTTTAASLNGNNAVAPAAANVLTFAGVVKTSSVADTGSGVYIAYGLASTRIFATGTSGTIGAGVAMGPAAGSNGVNSTGLKDVFGPVVSLEAIGAAVNSPGGYANGFVRAM
jgi:hypothetical protein